MRKFFFILVIIMLIAPVAFAANANDPHMYDESSSTDESAIQIPDNYTEHKTANFQFIYPEGGERIAEQITSRAEKMRARMVDEIGVNPTGTTRVYIARNQKDFNMLQPGGRPLPNWVAGVAYPHLNLVLMRQAGSSGQPINLLETFEHELSHIILRRVVKDRNALPKWFVEGLAQWQARQMDLERGMRLAKALISGRLIPLDDLIHRFPRYTTDIHLAYDESFAFLNFLIGEYGLDTFQSFIRRLGDGEKFVKAMESSYMTSLHELEKQWISDLKMSYNWIPLLSSGGTVWTLASILIIIGYIRKRRQTRIRMAKWEKEEAEAERIALLAEQIANEGLPESKKTPLVH